MNLGTMRTKVRDKLGETTENFFKDVAINEDLNEAVRVFCGEERWTWLQTIATGAIAASATSLTGLANVDVSRQAVLSITPASGDTRIRRLKRVSILQAANLEAEFSGSLTSGIEPRYYYVTTGGATGGTETLVPKLIPKADKGYNYTLYYYAFPAPMTTDADIPIIPTQYHEGLVARAAGMQWMKELNGGTKSQEQLMLYGEKLEAARQDEQQIAIDEPLVWGGVDPEYSTSGWDDFYGIHLPPTL